jgi:hypothetical protein
MSKLPLSSRFQASHRETSHPPQGAANPPLPGALSLLLQWDPNAIIEVELIEEPIDLPQDQFEALLFESECEV